MSSMNIYFYIQKMMKNYINAIVYNPYNEDLDIDIDLKRETLEIYKPGEWTVTLDHQFDNFEFEGMINRIYDIDRVSSIRDNYGKIYSYFNKLKCGFNKDEFFKDKDEFFKK